MYNPNTNSRVINPLTVVKTTFADAAVADMYLDAAEAVYEYGTGYKQHYDVVLVKRVTADMVRKFRCPFSNRQEATAFMLGLCSAADAETRIQAIITAAAAAIPPPQEKTLTEDGTSVKKPRFSFFDD